jgi:hypothetical protein
MCGDWRKRLHGKLIWRRLRSYVEARCSDHVCGFGCRRIDNPGSCSWATPMCDLSISFLIVRMNSARCATQDSYLNKNGTQLVVCVETIC